MNASCSVSKPFIVFGISEGKTKFLENLSHSLNKTNSKTAFGWFAKISFSNHYYNSHIAFWHDFGDNLKFKLNSQLTTIGDFAFYESGLTSIEIPASVTHIGWNAFANNTSLVNIVFKGTVEEWNTIEKASAWDAGVSKVVCTDGTITLE